MRHSNFFELNLSLPCDPRLSDALRSLAVHAAEIAGATAGKAEAFGEAVETALRESIDHCPSSGRLGVVVRRSTGPVEVVVEDQTVVMPSQS
jgi:hypothetical protein